MLVIKPSGKQRPEENVSIEHPDSIGCGFQSGPNPRESHEIEAEKGEETYQ